MPFQANERVNLRFEGDPDTAVLTFEGREFTVANGGLALQRDGGLIVILQLPYALGIYPYEFRDDQGHHETGKLRVTEARRRSTAAPVTGPQSVAPRRYKGA